MPLNARVTLGVLSSASLLTVLTACALLTASPAPSHDPTLVACQSFRLITWAPGDEKLALLMLQEVKDGKRAVSRETLTVLREAAGDTSPTISEVKGHNGAYRGLCSKPLPVGEKP